MEKKFVQAYQKPFNTPGYGREHISLDDSLEERFVSIASITDFFMDKTLDTEPDGAPGRCFIIAADSCYRISCATYQLLRHQAVRDSL